MNNKKKEEGKSQNTSNSKSAVKQHIIDNAQRETGHAPDGLALENIVRYFNRTRRDDDDFIEILATLGQLDLSGRTVSYLQSLQDDPAELLDYIECLIITGSREDSEIHNDESYAKMHAGLLCLLINLLVCKHETMQV